MTISTDAILCFGISFPDEDDQPEFPWYNEKFDQDLMSWWREEVLGFIHPNPIFDDEGGYIGGAEPSREILQDYYRVIRDFDESNSKPPVEVVIHCSDEYPMHILAVPSTIKRSFRGHPEKIVGMSVSQDEIDALVKFCEDQGIPLDGQEPAWWLASYWG